MSYSQVYYDNERFERIMKIAENYPDLSCFVYVQRGLYSGLSIKKGTPGIKSGDDLIILSPYLPIFQPIFQYEEEYNGFKGCNQYNQYNHFNDTNHFDDLDDILSLRLGLRY